MIILPIVPVNCLCFGVVERPVSLPGSMWCIPVSPRGDQHGAHQ